MTLIPLSGEAIGMGTIALALVGLLTWVVKALMKQHKEALGIVKQNSEAITGLKGSIESNTVVMRELKDSVSRHIADSIHYERRK